MSTARRQLDKAISEAAFQAQIIELAQMCGWKVAHFRAAQTGKGWRTPVSADGAGFPDLVLCHPERGPLLCWECKSETGKASPEQQAWLDALDALVNVDARVVRPSDWPWIESALKGEMAHSLTPYIERELTVAELAGKAVPMPETGPVEIAPERSITLPDWKTWLYRGFVLNSWPNGSPHYLCLRPVESGFPVGFKAWMWAQPETTPHNADKGGPSHKLADGTSTSCLECIGDLDACCRLIDRWWARVNGGGEMIQRLDELRGLLEKQADPKWAPMLALFIPGPNRQRTSAFWEALAQGALAGAIYQAWPGGTAAIPRDDQAAVDWAIARLEARRD